jgi:hypothetical protein
MSECICCSLEHKPEHIKLLSDSFYQEYNMLELDLECPVQNRLFLQNRYALCETEHA